MTRQNIFDLLNKEYNIAEEADKIISLFGQKLIKYEDIDGHVARYTPEEIFDTYIIHNWKQRGLFIASSEIRARLKIPKFFTPSSSFDDIVNFLEYCENILYLIVKKFGIFERTYWDVNNLFLSLIENIRLLIDKLGYEMQIIESEERVLLIPKKPVATAVAEISSEDTALAILKYNHTSLKGCLEEKRKLLYQISLEYEPILKTPIEGYKDFYEKTNGLLNTLHIRHNNTTKENNKNSIIDVSDEELEKWYDELYQLLLFCVLIKDNLERKKEVDEFLKSIKGAKA